MSRSGANAASREPWPMAAAGPWAVPPCPEAPSSRREAPWQSEGAYRDSHSALYRRIAVARLSLVRYLMPAGASSPCLFFPGSLGLGSVWCQRVGGCSGAGLQDACLLGPPSEVGDAIRRPMRPCCRKGIQAEAANGLQQMLLRCSSFATGVGMSALR